MMARHLRAIGRSICLGLLSLLIVTMMPAVAQPLNRPTQVAPAAISSLAVLEQSQAFYEAGRFVEMATVWEEAALTFEQQGDAIAQAWSLSHLSLAYQALGDWEQAESAIEHSLSLLQPFETANQQVLAQVLNNQGRLQMAKGQTQAALQTWQRSEAAYRSSEDREGILGSQLNQAQALQTLGLYRQARKVLDSIYQSLQKQPESLLKVQGLQSLGVALQVGGDLPRSREVLEQSLKIAQRLSSNADASKILFSLGNTAKDLQEPQKALAYYQQAASITNNPRVELEAQLNQLSLYLELEEEAAAIALLEPIATDLDKLPPSRTSVYAAVNFAESLAQLAASSATGEAFLQEAAQVSAGGLQQAKAVGDRRSQAYALAQLGSLYEQTQQHSEALSLTKQALQIAQEMQASELVARASWQLGRLLNQQGDKSGAIAAYQTAFSNIELLRREVAINSDLQFSFTQTVEPVYRQLVGLLLDPSKAQAGGPSQANLQQAREVIEALRLAELENFFREACLEAQPVQVDQIDAQAAVIYPIILPDRLEVILSLPGQPLRNYTTNLPEAEVEQTLRQMRQSLHPAFSRQERLSLYQQAYEWLVQPAQPELERLGIKTLVFIPDGRLRNLPMAALHDGEQYLVEKYSVALNPGLQLLKPQKDVKLQAVTAGLSEARHGFRSLPQVRSELTQISSAVKTQVLLNQEFTSTQLKQTIESTSSPIVHLATHGQFSSRVEDTFILAWNEQIDVKELDELLRSRGMSETNRIELLVLSACQTAQGDERAALGLAGIAVRSGASSTLGTLWAVRDRSTAKLMSEFYKYLDQPGVTKSEALRRAQLSLLKGEYSLPVYWAPFVLVGNWL